MSYPVALLHDILADAQPVCVIVNEKTFGNDLQGRGCFFAIICTVTVIVTSGDIIRPSK